MPYWMNNIIFESLNLNYNAFIYTIRQVKYQGLLVRLYASSNFAVHLLRLTIGSTDVQNASMNACTCVTAVDIVSRYLQNTGMDGHGEYLYIDLSTSSNFTEVLSNCKAKDKVSRNSSSSKNLSLDSLTLYLVPVNENHVQSQCDNNTISCLWD